MFLKFALPLVVLLLAHCAKPLVSSAVDPYTAEITQWQEELNQHYLDPEHSPLPAADRAVFTAHPFYPIDPAYLVVADLLYPGKPRVLEMPTSSGSIKTFRVFAVASFTLRGEEESIQILQPTGRTISPNNYLFIPFQDATSGNATYGGGRYIDMPLPEGQPETLVIDFNRAYHPYCAYTDGYNCPIPPQENRMQIAIEAGIKL